MTTIVVPLDGSVFAERALRPACAIAARLDHARVVLVSCAPDDTDVARHQLDDRAGLYSEVVDIETRIVDEGQPADTILETVAQEPDGMLCMATHGSSGFKATVLGGVATQVVCRSTRPLFLVGPNCRTALLPAERGRLVACSDGSEVSNRILPTAAAWCSRLRLEPWLTEVVPPDEYLESARPSGNRQVDAASERLGKLSDELHALTTEARIEVLHGAPSRSIAWFAERLPAAVIAMATHGRSGLTRFTMGSVATDVVRHAPCPVLISRPSDTEASFDG